MTAESKTDSLLSTELDPVSTTDTWSDIRLIRESDSGWSVVYSGLYRGRRVAIKGLRQEYRSSRFHRDILHKEFEVTSGLNHQNIASALWMEDVPDIGEAILMEYIDGVTLTDYVASNPTIGRKHIMDIIGQICSAVSYMHSRQTIHCDLKPSNIMITASGFIKLIDLGMSRGNGFEKLDFPGGTKGFTAPENFNSDSKATVAVDIYSIGKILELIDHEGQFKSVWKRCQSSNPEKRPASAAEVSELLNQLAARKRQRKNISVGICIALGIAIISVGSYVMWHSFSGYEITNEPPVSITDTVQTETIYELPDSPTPPSATDRGETIEPIHKPLPLTEQTEEIAQETPADDRPFKEQLAEKFQKVAGMRFKQHLDLIDTMTTVRSNELQTAEYWRWLVKQDMRKWLEEKLAPNYPRIEEEMKNLEQYIDDYANFSHRRGIEWSHRLDAAKRCPDLIGSTTAYAFYETEDILVVRKLGEDGKWHEEKIRVPIDRSDPEATMKIKHEYMEKAMGH